MCEIHLILLLFWSWANTMEINHWNWSANDYLPLWCLFFVCEAFRRVESIRSDTMLNFELIGAIAIVVWLLLFLHYIEVHNRWIISESEHILTRANLSISPYQSKCSNDNELIINPQIAAHQFWFVNQTCNVNWIFTKSNLWTVWIREIKQKADCNKKFGILC